MTPRKKWSAKAANTVIAELKRRRMEAWYCEDLDKAKEKVLELIPEGASVSWGGSMTLVDSGVLDAVRQGPYTVIDRASGKTKTEVAARMHEALSCDVYLTSSNAITRSGELVNTDGSGNRVAALIYGPKSVIVVAGVNKLVADVEAGFERIRNLAAPMNCQRLDRNTPCSVTGFCGECFGDDSICSSQAITRRSHIKGRIKVILVGEELGY